MIIGVTALAGKISRARQTTYYSITGYFADNDGDTYGEMADVILACVTPPGYVESAGDCNDNDPAINPSTSEICNLIDDNCNGFADEGAGNVYYLDSDSDGYGDLSISTISCSTPASFVENYSDCDDTNASLNPSAIEICNGIDDNCADGIDNGLQFNNYYSDIDGDGYGDASSVTTSCSEPAGFVVDNSDCDDTMSSVNPNESETCNGIDDDCDTQVDEDGGNTYYADVDGDGYGDVSNTTNACSVPAGYVFDNTDCNDELASVNSGQPEVCNGIDDNCNSQLDEGLLAQVSSVVSCESFFWSENNTTYNTSGTYYSNVPLAATYNTYESFALASNSAGHQLSDTEDFSEFWGYLGSANGSLGEGFPSWSAEGVNGLFAYQVNGSTAIGANQNSSTLTFNFSQGVQGVGGNFFVSDVDGNVIIKMEMNG
jgi:hypothetical protein